MVTFLVARVPAGPSGVGAERLPEPASGLVRRQLDALGAGADGLADAARTAAAQLDPGVAGALAALAAVVVAAFAVAAVAVLVTARPRSAA